MRKNRKTELTIDVDSTTANQTSERYAPSSMLELDDAWQEKLTVVFRADRLGDGDDELGKQLLSEAVTALTRHPEPPEAILFYHRGVQLTLGSSPVLEPLRALQARGSCLLVCESSLAAYTDTDPDIGRAVPLAELIEQMRRAGRVIWF